MSTRTTTPRAGRRAAWADPVRKLRTLESFARTEEDGGRDIAAALKVVSDAELKKHLERHAADELRHAELFRGRALELRGEGVVAAPAEESDKPYDLARGMARGGSTVEVDAHGFLRVGLADELGEIAYVAMLHVAEKRAASLFRRLAREVDDDPPTRAMFESILKDEHYHVAYTGTLLERWRKEGRGMEVKRALSQARGSRFLGAWKRFGARSGAAFSRVVLVVLYFTLLLPFGVLARLARPRSGWSERSRPAGRSASDLLRSTY